MGIEDMLAKSTSKRNRELALQADGPVAVTTAELAGGSLPVGEGGPKLKIRRPEYLIPLDLIRPDPNNYADRKLVRDDDMLGLMATIRSIGLQQAIEVRLDPDWPASGTRYMIIKGERRWTAHKWLRDEDRDGDSTKATKFDEIVATLSDEALDDFELFRRQHAENHFRQDVPLLNEVKSYSYHLAQLKAKNPDYEQKQLADALGLTKDELSKCLRIADAHKEIHKLIQRYDFGLEDAELLVRIWDHTIGKGVKEPPEKRVAAIKKLAERRANGDLTREDLRDEATDSKKKGSANPDRESKRAKPYFEIQDDSVQVKAAKLKLSEPFEGPVAQQFASDLVKLLTAMLEKYPALKPTLKELLKD